jgi:hypothetical protein
MEVGAYRKTEKTNCVPVVQINEAMAAFLGDASIGLRKKRSKRMRSQSGSITDLSIFILSPTEMGSIPA